jgi:hypothetical protein
MKTNIRSVALPTIILLLGVLACNTSAFPAPQPTAASVVEQPAPAGSISESVTLSSIQSNEESQTPAYKITAQIPFLEGSTDPRVQAFNVELKSIAQKEMDAFKSNLADLAATPSSTDSSLDVRYELVSQKGNFWSLKYEIFGYTKGAAHPYHYTITVNHDLENGRDVTLDAVFLPDSNYLQIISDYCKAELKTRDISFEGFEQGADPTPGNYHNWNLSEEGLVITFDEYQVAAYAAGAQAVVIPFGELGQLINDQGPIALYLP